VRAVKGAEYMLSCVCVMVVRAGNLESSVSASTAAWCVTRIRARQCGADGGRFRAPRGRFSARTTVGRRSPSRAAVAHLFSAASVCAAAAAAPPHCRAIPP
jgi:hypothetical protein